jgi:hypothetical protein
MGISRRTVLTLGAGCAGIIMAMSDRPQLRSSLSDASDEPITPSAVRPVAIDLPRASSAHSPEAANLELARPLTPRVRPPGGDDLFPMMHRADLDHSGVLDLSDVLKFQQLWLSQNAGADFNRDGQIDILDLQAFVQEFLHGEWGHRLAC